MKKLLSIILLVSGATMFGAAHPEFEIIPESPVEIQIYNRTQYDTLSVSSNIQQNVPLSWYKPEKISVSGSEPIIIREGFRSFKVYPTLAKNWETVQSKYSDHALFIYKLLPDRMLSQVTFGTDMTTVFVP